MKKIIALGLAIVMAFSMVACGGNANEGGSEDNSQAVVVDENLMSVEITLPASYWEDSDETVEQYAERMKNEGTFKEVTVNENGSVTVKMSKADHKKLLNEVKDQLTSMFPMDGIASIKKLEVNGDVTNCKLIVDQEAFENSFDIFAVLAVAAGVQMYHVYEGNPDAISVIHYIDEASNTEFGSFNLPEGLEAFGQ